MKRAPIVNNFSTRKDQIANGYRAEANVYVRTGLDATNLDFSTVSNVLARHTSAKQSIIPRHRHLNYTGDEADTHTTYQTDPLKVCYCINFVDYSE